MNEQYSIRWSWLASTAAWLAAAALAPVAVAQTVFVNSWVPAGAGNWNVQANWFDQVNGINSIPNGAAFDDRATIANGGTADVQGTNPPPPGDVQIINGTLNVQSGATLSTVVSINGLLNGSVLLNRGANQTATLNVLPGGTLAAAGPLLSAGNAANIINLGGTAAGTATVNVPAASFNGTTRVYPNAAFTSTGTVTLGPAGSYSPQINGTSAASLNVGQNVVLGGTLNPVFTGPVPAVGSAWSLMQADAILGNFANITSALTLPANQRLMTRVVPVAGQRQRLDLELSEVLVLTVNRDTGVMAITHPGSSVINLDAYTIASSQGRLVAGSWNSLTDQSALGGSWNKAGANASSLSELRPSGNGAANAGANVALGPIYNALGGTFAATVADVSFQYSDKDGRIVNGVVNYTGTTLNNLLLQIDPTTGRGTLRNTSTTPVNIDSYAISSTASLTPATWNSLDDQNAAGGDWLEILDASPALLGEFKSFGATTLGPSASFDLGVVFNPAAARDLTFEFLQSGQFTATVGAVVYEAATDADFDNDNDVDGNDFLRWQRGVGTNTGATNAQGDANGDGAVNGADLAIWKSKFGGSPVAAAMAAVPEPASVALLVGCVGSVAGLGRRSRKRCGQK
jgi:hypothetical protein